MKQSVRISRKWKNHHIKTVIIQDDKGISIETDIKEFLNAMVNQITYIPLTMTKAQLKAKVTEAAKLVLIEMKEQTAKT